MNRMIKAVVITGLLALALQIFTTLPAICAPKMGIYFDGSMNCRPDPFVIFDATLYLTDADYYVTGVEYMIDVPDASFYIIGVSYPPEFSIDLGDPMSGHSITYWPPLNGFSGAELLCTYECLTLTSCQYMGYYYPLTIVPHPDSGGLRGTFAPDNELFDIIGLTSYLCPDHWPPELDRLEVLTPTCLEVSFNNCVYDWGRTYADQFWLYRADSPEDSIAVVSATKLSSSFGDNADFMLLLGSPMIGGVTYILEASACCECMGCAVSQREFTFEGGFADMPDLAATYLIDYETGYAESAVIPLECGPAVFDIRVVNAGTVASGPFSIGIFVESRDLPGTGAYIDTIGCAGLAAGAILYETVSAEIPPGLLTYHNDLSVVADIFGEVGEWTEENNSLTASLPYYNPEIVSVVDVPVDYGGWVDLTFRASFYEIRYPGDADYYEIERFDPAAEAWEQVATVDAAGDTFYTLPAPTLVDSCAAVGDYMTRFRVRILRYNYIYSCERSGYSIDNLGPIAVMLEASDVRFLDSSVRLSWTISSSATQEESGLEFAVSRAKTGMAFDLLDIKPSSTGPGSFQVVDTGIEPGNDYRYRVEYIDGGEKHLLFESETVGVPAMPLALEQNRPNPFNPSTEISYYLPSPGPVSIEIFDVAGRQVRMLVRGSQPAGRYAAEWNGRDDSGAPVASGIYFYRLSAGKETLTKKMVLLR